MMFDKQYHLETSKVFCMAPWVHTHIWPNGDVFPCCLAESQLPLTNYKKEGDLKTVWNSDAYKQLRKNMLSGKESPECVRCYEHENRGKVNLRNQLNSDYSRRFDLVEKTKDDGHLEEIEILYLDIRFSNICNLSCRTCGPDLSSQWASIHAAKYPSLAKNSAIIRIESDSKAKHFWDDLSQYIEKVDRIYFAGGEPLLMQEHYNLLNYLIDRSKVDIAIYYNTNFTTFDFKGDSVIEYWKKFSNVVVCASLDDSGERGEFIRKGLVWDQIVENRKRMIAECPNVKFMVAPTLSVFNADHVLDFYEEWVNLGLLQKYYMQFNVLLYPKAYRVELLPAEVKASISQKIDTLVENARSDPNPNVMVDRFITDITQFKNALLAEVDSTQKEELLLELNNRITELDTDRNESTWDLIPAIYPLKRQTQ